MFTVNADLNMRVCVRTVMRVCARACVCVIVCVCDSMSVSVPFKCSLGGLNSQSVQRKAFYHRNKQGYNHVSMPTVGLQLQMVGPNQVECSEVRSSIPSNPRSILNESNGRGIAVLV